MSFIVITTTIEASEMVLIDEDVKKRIEDAVKAEIPCQLYNLKIESKRISEQEGKLLFLKAEKELISS